MAQAISERRSPGHLPVKTAWAAFLLCLCPPPLSAGSGTILSWKDCVAQALRENPDLAAARRAREAGRASYYGSFGGVLPRLSLSNGYGDSSGGSDAPWQAQGTAGLDLFNYGRIADIRASAAALSLSEAGLRQASSDLRLDLRKAFLQLLFSQENIEVSRRVLEIRRRGSQLVALRYDSGRESRGNMLRAKAQLLQAEADMAQATRELRTSGSALLRRLGLERFQVLAATGALAPSARPDPPEHEEALLSLRPDVAAQEALLRSARASLASARGAFWPSLSASYTRSVSGNRAFPSSRYGWAAGGTLSYPLFGGGLTSAHFGVSAAGRNLERAREELRSVRGQALSEMENSRSDFTRALSQAEVQAALLEASRQRNEEADIRYASGLLSYDNWEIISSDRVGQERQALQARLNAAVAEAVWDRALGRELGEEQ